MIHWGHIRRQAMYRSRFEQYRSTQFETLENRQLLSVSPSALAYSGLSGVSAFQTSLLNKDGQFLSGPTVGDPLAIATQFLASQAGALGLTPGDLNNFELTNRFVSDHTGVTHLYLRQTFNGLEIADANLNINIAADGSVINVGSSFIPGLQQRTTSTVPSLSPIEAATAFASTLGYSTSTVPSVRDFFGGVGQATLLDFSSLSLDSIPVELQYVMTADQGLRLGWNAVARTPDGDHWLDASVDAGTGELLRLSDWVSDASDASFEVFAVPLEGPQDGNRSTVVNANDPTASPFGWNDIDGVVGADFTDTRGNNVFAQEDVDADNAGGFRPDGGAGLDFSFPLDLALEPDAYQAAAITNLFYANNIAHDVSYKYGFNEASGNFQVNNYGRGGLGGDAVQADAQDGSGTDNANFATPPDGFAPRMQQFVFTFTSPQRDSDLSNTIIWHEFGHGISNRLTGGAANSNALEALQSGGMGEGWSDWWGLMLTQKVSDGKFDAYPVGNYVLGLPDSGPGIRRVPYSFDLAIDPRTYGDFNGGFPNNQVHNAGEIWASALWDMNWLLVDKLGFDPDLYNGTGGNNLTMQLVLDGMKLQPANPSFIDARDAILMADQILTGGANEVDIWTAFARRGMGFSASDGGSGNSPVVIEAFDLPAFPPLALNDFATTLEDTPVSINVLANDSDLDGQLIPSTVQVIAGPAFGTTQVNTANGQVLYTPAPNFAGIDVFSYNVQDDNGETSNVATVTVTITPVNDPPTAVDDVAGTAVNAPVLIDVLANDFDIDSQLNRPTLQIIGQPANGTTLIDFGTQRVMYTPNPGFSGADVFTYRVRDVEGALSNTAQVTLRVGDPVSFSGAVFADRNDDGAFDADELGIPGVTITISKTDGPVVFSVSVQTAADGSFSLVEAPGSGFILPAGVYSITEVHPTPFLDGKDTAGVAGGIVLNDSFQNITLGSGQTAAGYLFGERGLSAEFLAEHPELRRFFASTQPGNPADFFGPTFVSPGDAVGAVRSAGFSLRTSNTNEPAGLPTFNFGLPQWHPISGDWNGDGIDTIGAYNSETATFFLSDINEGGVANYPAFNFGIPGWVPLAGDWNGDGIDTIGVYNPATATFFLRNQNNTGVAEVPAFNYGIPNWVPLAGDWEGLGIDTIGVYNPATATYFLRYTNDSGPADVPAFNYGIPGWQPLVGDWNDDGIETAGAYNPATATFFLRNSNTSGVGDVAFNYGTPGSTALAGQWMSLSGQTLLLDGDAGSVRSSEVRLATDDVMPLLAEAIGKWNAAGLDPTRVAQLADVEIRIADLPGRQLALAAEDRIYLDLNAAGQGWFVDDSPSDDAEFTRETAFGWQSESQLPAANRIDLLTVLVHELGHITGLADGDDDSLDIMYESLATGTRRSAEAEAVAPLLGSK